MAHIEGTATHTTGKADQGDDDPDVDKATADLLYQLGDAGKAKLAAALAAILSPAILEVFGDAKKTASADQRRYRDLATKSDDPDLRRGYEELADEELDQWFQRLVEEAVREAFADLDTKTARADRAWYLKAAANATDRDLKSAYLTRAAAITRRAS